MNAVTPTIESDSKASAESLAANLRGIKVLRACLKLSSDELAEVVKTQFRQLQEEELKNDTKSLQRLLLLSDENYRDEKLRARRISLFAQYSQIFQSFSMGNNGTLFWKTYDTGMHYSHLQQLFKEILVAHQKKNVDLSTKGLRITCGGRFLVKEENGIAHLFLSVVTVGYGGSARVRKVVNITMSPSSPLYGVHKRAIDSDGVKDVANAVNNLTHFYKVQKEDHPHVEGKPIALLGDNGYIAPFYQNGTLYDRLKKEDLFSPLRLQWVREMFLGTQALLKAGIIHCDISPFNCLIDEKDHLHICDLGSSIIKGIEPSHWGKWNTLYTHPSYAKQIKACNGYQQSECLQQESDQWRLGATTFKTLCNESVHPYIQETNAEKQYAVPNILDSRNLDFFSIMPLSTRLKDTLRKIVVLDHDKEKPFSWEKSCEVMCSLTESDAFSTEESDAQVSAELDPKVIGELSPEKMKKILFLRKCLFLNSILAKKGFETGFKELQEQIEKDSYRATRDRKFLADLLLLSVEDCSDLDLVTKRVHFFVQYAQIFEAFTLGEGDTLVWKGVDTSLSFSNMRQLFLKLLSLHVRKHPGTMVYKCHNFSLTVVLQKNIVHLFKSLSTAYTLGNANACTLLHFTANPIGDPHVVLRWPKEDTSGAIYELGCAFSHLEFFYKDLKEDHPHVEGRPIVTLYPQVGYIGRYYKKGPLSQYLKDPSHSLSQRLQWIKELFLGFQALVEKRIIATLSLDNCYLDQGNRLHICVLGKSNIMDDGEISLDPYRKKLGETALRILCQESLPDNLAKEAQQNLLEAFPISAKLKERLADLIMSYSYQPYSQAETLALCKPLTSEELTIK